MDLTEVSPHVGLKTRDFIVEQKFLKFVSNNVVKHKEVDYDNQRVFIAFVLDTFDFIALVTLNILQRVQIPMHINLMSPRVIIFEKIDFFHPKESSGAVYSLLPFML